MALASCVSGSAKLKGRAPSSRRSIGASRTPATAGLGCWSTQERMRSQGNPTARGRPHPSGRLAIVTGGFVVSQAPLRLTCDYWVRVPQQGGWLYLVAMDDIPGASWRTWFLSLVDAAEEELSDRHGATYRAALVHGQRLAAAAVLTEGDSLPASSWLAALLSETSAIMRPPGARFWPPRMPELAADCGPIVCACFGVGRNQIVEAVVREKLASAEAIGRRLKAGTNCGSCVPELRRMFADATA